jgi:hypothetical protein
MLTERKHDKKTVSIFPLPTVACIFNYKLRAGPLLPKTAKKRVCERQIRRFDHTDSRGLDVFSNHLRLLLPKFHPRVTNLTVDG